MDEKYTVAAIRRTWDAIVGRAFEETGKVRMTGDEVRRFMSDYIENKAETSRQKFWDLLSPEDKHRILELAFPHGSYTRPEKGSVFISAPASAETSKLRETLVDRGFDPFTLEDAEAGGRSISDLINDSIDRADLVLVVVPHHGTRNPNVFIELGYALAKKKRILALIPPGEELPLGDVPYLRTELDNLEAIGFGLDQVLAAPKGKGKGKSRKDGIKKTKPLGAAADRLLDEVRANRGQITETEFMDIVRRAIEESGVSTVVSGPAAADREVDFAVWSDDLEPLIKNPVVIELKSRLRGKEHFEQTIAQLVRALDMTHTQVGLLIYAASDGNIDEEAVHDPRILVFSLEDFLHLLKENGFGDLLRRARNVRVHGGS
jgi:TIR domain/Restriction endonuclease